MMSLSPSFHIQIRRGDNVRIGPISVITLIIVICMAVLAVLAASTSNASAAISSRMADGTRMLYANEIAGQEFVSEVDAVLARVRASGGDVGDASRAIGQELDGICGKARQAGGVQCTADVKGTQVTAEFICDDTRQLDIVLTIRNDLTYRIEEWDMASTQQEAAPAGSLWTGA